MKRIFTLILLVGGLSLAGCSDWLDVRPQTETTKELMFETQKGFRDALIGAYIRLKGGNAYGDALTWGNIEFMAQHWDLPAVSASSALANLKRYEYTNTYVEGWMGNMYYELFRVIADVNSILERIDDKKEIFDPGAYELVKGEALALRAFCHFDVLRMFGPIPGDTIATGPVLPYVKTVTNQVHPRVTAARFADLVLEDLDEAERLLQPIDPITQYSIEALNASESSGGFINLENTFLAYRQIRFNYHAVIAAKARVYLWTRDNDNARLHAQKVIDAKDKDGNPTFRLADQSDMTLEDYAASPEHILAISLQNLATTAESRFGQGGSLMKQDLNYYLGNLFPTAEQTTDIRFKLWIPRASDNNYKILTKFIQRASRPPLQVPLLRLSEMYLILAEATPNLAEASTIYGRFCTAKGIPFNTFSDEADRRSRIVREYNREFYAEGQGFFTYKRLNTASILWASYPITGSPAVYVVPLPRRELEYINE
ncbi:MAG: RagB/SusD family nutrient uptake outer membrane protein [Odoribacteraceae bacterium]|jgi:hypothetical protein|nr:RagB/SusD family nutrient uptake outer membrane protein [Odoribacteraceae bacterium]